MECLRMLRTALTSAIKPCTNAINQIRSLLVSAPETIRAKYRGLPTQAMITALAPLPALRAPAETGYITALTLKTLGLRYQPCDPKWRLTMSSCKRSSTHTRRYSVFNVETNDELHTILGGFPMYPYLNIKVTPVATYPNSIG